MHPILDDDTYIEIIGDEYNYDYCIFKDNSYDSYTIDENMALELKNADGKRPLNISEEEMIWLKEKKFIQTSRYVKGKENNRFIVILIGSRTNKFKKIARYIAYFLPIISNAIFLLGVFFALSRGISINSLSNNLFLFVLLIMISVLFHEAGHLIVGISLGYYFSDLSILLCKYIPIPIGMCVCRKDVDSECDFNAKDEISFYMAGIEMELMLTGLFLFLSTICAKQSLTLLVASLFNIITIIYNLLPSFFKTDGEMSLSIYLGVDSINSMAKKWLLDHNKRKKLVRGKGVGLATAIIFIFCLMSDFIVIASVFYEFYIIICLLK